MRCLNALYLDGASHLLAEEESDLIIIGFRLVFTALTSHRTMSNQPPTPSYGDVSHYTHPWPPPSNPFPSAALPPFLPQNFPYAPNLSLAPHPSRDSSNQPREHNETQFNANSRLPGLGAPGSGAALPPPPFPFLNPFTPPQFPSPLPSMQMPPMNYSLPIPHAPMNAPPSRPLTGDIQSQANSIPANMVDIPATFTSPAQHDPDREEGELTDREGGWPQSSPRPCGKQPGPVNGLGAETRPQMQTRRRRSKSRYSDLEEGEASPDPHSSSRASGSRIYTPIITMHVLSTNTLQHITPRCR